MTAAYTLRFNNFRIVRAGTHNTVSWNDTQFIVLYDKKETNKEDRR